MLYTINLMLMFLIFFNILFMNSFLFIMILWLEIIILFFIYSLHSNSYILPIMMGTSTILILSIVVCEATIALSMLVLLSRNPSSISMKSLSLLKC